MAIRVLSQPPLGWDSIPSDGVLSCFDTLEEPEEWWTHDWDELLHFRSVYEFIRADLNAAQLADLDKIDAWWKAHPQAFNKAFSRMQAWSDKKTALEGFVADEDGNTPEIPKSHWWWWKLDEGNV